MHKGLRVPATRANALPKNPAPPAPAESLSFEAAVKELEAIVAQMESDDQPLEDSLTAYKRGAELIRAAQSRLSIAEQQVKILEDGMLKPLIEGGGAS